MTAGEASSIAVRILNGDDCRTLVPILASWVAEVAPAIERLRAASEGLGLEGASHAVYEAVCAVLDATEEE